MPSSSSPRASQPHPLSSFSQSQERIRTTTTPSRRLAHMPPAVAASRLCRSRPTPFLPHPLSPSVLKTEVVCSAHLWTPAAAEVQIRELLRGIRASIGRIWVVAPGAALPFAGADAELPPSPAVGCCGHGARLREVSFAGETQEPARTATSGRAGGRRRARASPGSPGHCHRLAQIHALLASARPHRRSAPRPVRPRRCLAQLPACLAAAAVPQPPPPTDSGRPSSTHN